MKTDFVKKKRACRKFDHFYAYFRCFSAFLEKPVEEIKKQPLGTN